jgi:hypothetical protein
LAVGRSVRRTALFLPALLLGVALLGQASAARADGLVQFNKMTVEHCDKVVGSCIWKLNCDLGKPVAFDLVSGAKVGTAGVVVIHQAFRVPQFPVQAHCALSIDDGWFRTSWKKVADASLEIPAGGDYNVDLDSTGAGTVHVHVAADSLEMAPAPAAAAAATGGKGKAKAAAPGTRPRVWLGLYHSGEEGQAVVIGYEWDPFKARLDKLAAKGVKLLRFKSYKEGGKTLWAGIFGTVAEEETVISGLEWEAFSAKWKDLTNHGMRLVDLETYDNGKKRLFAGVFREGGDQYALWVGLEEQAFARKFNELSASGLRLIDLNTYRSGKQRLFAGVFRAGVGTYGMWPNLQWDALSSKTKEASSSGTELSQVVTYADGKERLFTAVLRNRTTSGTDLGRILDGPAFAISWGDMAAKGWRLVDLETIPED